MRTPLSRCCSVRTVYAYPRHAPRTSPRSRSFSARLAQLTSRSANATTDRSCVVSTVSDSTAAPPTVGCARSVDAPDSAWCIHTCCAPHSSWPPSTPACRCARFNRRTAYRTAYHHHLQPTSRKFRPPRGLSGSRIRQRRVLRMAGLNFPAAGELPPQCSGGLSALWRPPGRVEYEWWPLRCVTCGFGAGRGA
jgi:hypothetical protein